jgi:pimeloyl-ACP methyl ester carboxylesterase
MTRPPRATLVLVHGPCLGPASLADTLVPRLEPLGLRCVVPDLHDAWPTRGWSARVARLPLERYVDRLHGAFGALPGPRLLLGHSMGARIVERLVLRGWHDGAVLIAPAPPEGLEVAARELARRAPLAAARALIERRPARLFGEPGCADPRRVARLLMPPGAPKALADRLAGQLRDESFAACLEWLRPHAAPPPELRVPVLAIGGRDDPLVSPALLRRAAAVWHAAAHLVPHAGHCPMLGEGAAAIAGHVGRWLDDLRPGAA